jgi:hypothetical protein
MTNFVNKRKNTNVVIMRMSHRFDLEVLLYADYEVKVFNRKIKKKMKICNHIKIINISSNRKCYAKHGLHMNVMGQKWITHTTANVIKKSFTSQKAVPVILE